ncbi:MAG: zinc ribbon domain-containing protein [Thermoflexales bacterium]|nr:zinc ribbon domain-containing protein [Thermoflexales bacterium]
MSFGSLLIGLALALIVGAWLARPFRRAGDPDRAIEHWVAQARAARREPPAAAEASPEEEEIRFCPRCGRRVGPEDRFCARCGAPLRRGPF